MSSEKEKGIERNKDGSGKVIDAVTGENLELRKIDANGDTTKIANMDHVMPINHIRKKYKNNPYLYRDDLEKIISLTDNESYINQKLNGGSFHGKGDKTWSEYINNSLKDSDGNVIENGKIMLSPEQQKKALELENKANKAQNKEAAKAMAKKI